LPQTATIDIVSIVAGENSPDLDQVCFPAELTYLDAVRRYYEER
jgi:hypothetical protein